MNFIVSILYAFLCAFIKDIFFIFIAVFKPVVGFLIDNWIVNFILDKIQYIFNFFSFKKVAPPTPINPIDNDLSGSKNFFTQLIEFFNKLIHNIAMSIKGFFSGPSSFIACHFDLTSPALMAKAMDGLAGKTLIQPGISAVLHLASLSSAAIPIALPIATSLFKQVPAKSLLGVFPGFLPKP